MPRAKDEIDFGGRLRAARTARGWTQQDLSVATDLSQSYIARLESSKRHPGLATADRIASCMGLTLDMLLFPEKTKEPGGEQPPGPDAPRKKRNRPITEKTRK